jgi:hypothetical protein
MKTVCAYNSPVVQRFIKMSRTNFVKSPFRHFIISPDKKTEKISLAFVIKIYHVTTMPVILHFLKLGKFPSNARLWCNLAETRRQLRYFKREGLKYARDFGIYDQNSFNRVLLSLQLREKLVERMLIKRGKIVST